MSRLRLALTSAVLAILGADPCSAARIAMKEIASAGETRGLGAGAADMRGLSDGPLHRSAPCGYTCARLRRLPLGGVLAVRMGRVGIEPTTLGLRVPCSAS